MDAHIVRVVHEQRTRHLTQFHYIPVLLYRSLQPTDWQMRVEVDGSCLVPSANVVCVGNSRSYGGPVAMTSAASPTDGCLDVVAARITEPLEMFHPGLAALMRGLHHSRSVIYARGRHVRVTSPLEDVPWELDGDFYGYLPARIHLEPGGVRLLTPGHFAPRARKFR
jgi:diacylglycerol kinase family enzyme